MVNEQISRSLYFIVLIYYKNFYPLSVFLKNSCFLKKLLFPPFYIKNALKLASFNGFLRSNLEFLDQLGQLRIEISKCNNEWIEQKTFNPNEKIKIGFFGVFGLEANFPKEFFINHPDNVEVYIYDLIRPKKESYKGTDIFDGYEEVYYRKTPVLKPWENSTENYKELIKMIEGDNIDVFINLTLSYILPVFDKLKVPILLHMATTQIHLPHSKFHVQGFVQPSWPYEVKDGKIFNLKSKKFLDSFYAKDDGLMFNLRGAKNFKRKKLEEKKKQIFFMGHLKKLAQNDILNILYKLLISDDKTTFVYYGKGDKYQKIIYDFFAKHDLLDKIKYKGIYRSEFDKNGNLIDDGNVYNAYNDLFDSRLFFNTFPMRATRSCFEAYYAGVAVVHLDFNDNTWLKNQKLNPYKGPMVLTKSGSVSSVEEYKIKCLNIMKDNELYYKIANEQDEIIKKVTNVENMWQKIFFMIEKDQYIKKLK